MVVDMGTHMLRGVPGLHLVVQLLTPGLEERARALPPLNSTYATPGKPLMELPPRVACPRRVPVSLQAVGLLCRCCASAWCMPASGLTLGCTTSLTVLWLTVQATLMLQGQ